jgi:hypothetical protein
MTESTERSHPVPQELTLRLDHCPSRKHRDKTLAFLTLTPRHGTGLDRCPLAFPGPLRYLLLENRVDPFKLASVVQAEAIVSGGRD